MKIAFRGMNEEKKKKKSGYQTFLLQDFYLL